MGSQSAAVLAVVRGVSDGHVPYDPTSALAMMQDASDRRDYVVDAPVSADREGLTSPGGWFRPTWLRWGRSRVVDNRQDHSHDSRAWSLFLSNGCFAHFSFIAAPSPPRTEIFFNSIFGKKVS